MAKPKKIIILKRFEWGAIWAYPFVIITLGVLFILSFIPILGAGILEYFVDRVSHVNDNHYIYKKFSEVFFKSVKYRIIEERKITKLERV